VVDSLSSLTAIRHIYKNIASHTKIRPFIRKNAPNFLEDISLVDLLDIKGLIEGGRAFTADLFEIHVSAYLCTKVGNPCQDEIERLKSELKKSQDMVKKLQEKHDRWLGNFRVCDCKSVEWEGKGGNVGGLGVGD
jgi:hypothetical protein